MADDSEAATNDELIEVTLKTPKQKHNFRVKPNISVKELKEKATKEFSATIEQLVLIFSGKILKDVDTIDQHSIKNGHVIHLVIKSSASKNSQQSDSSGNSSSTTAARSEPQQHQQPQQPTQAPGSMFGLGGLEGLSSLGLGTGDLRGMQQQMQRELMSNPEALSQIMDNPMVQSMMSNPELLQQLIMNNPQMQQLMERNPEITHMLNNPQLMRQTMELARNPAMLQEMMRNQDRAMSNLESIPGGYNALHRMYTEYQEPMLNAAQEQFGQNPFAGLVSNNQNSESQRQNTENTEPLPNPWAATGGGRTSTVTTTSSSTPKSCSGTQSTAGSNQTTPNASGMFGTPAMQDLMSQISSNPSLVQNMMNSPYVQNMMRNMTNNPDLSSQILLQNPMFANNPQMREMLPSMIEQMQRPEMQAAMSNPRALEAMMQVQAGLQTLQREAPGVLGFTGHPPTTSAPTTNNSSTPTTTGVTTPTPPNSAATMAMLNSMMRAGIITGGAGAGNPLGGATQEAPETRFRLELEQLSQMGFINQEANIRALQTTGGNINQAVELLLLNRDGR